MDEGEIASEYRYRKPVVSPSDLVIGVSQSGETADTLADHDPPVLSSTIVQRVVFADAAQSGRLVFELAEQSAAAREIAALAAAVARIAP